MSAGASVILVDTSAWIEYLRSTGHPAHLTLKYHLIHWTPIATTEVVIMELLAGTRSRAEHARLRNLLLAFPQLSLRGLPDYENAAELYRSCRRQGATVRKLIDCLIAAVAIREGATLLHNDRDFDALARHAQLQTEPFIP